MRNSSAGFQWLLFAALMLSLSAAGQSRQTPRGHSIGTVAVHGHLIVMTLNPGVLGHENLFDLDHRTLRFTPAGAGYRIQNLPLHWNPDFGPAAKGPDVTLQHFAFPFSGKQWRHLSVGGNGSITFTPPPKPAPPPPPPGRFARFRFFRRGGVQMTRFAQLRDEGRALVASTVPAICVFLRQAIRGPHYVSQLADRVVITWDLRESAGGIQDYTWTPNLDRFQAVLHANGTIEMSYQQIQTRDAVVGVYPHLHADAGKTLAALHAAPGSSALRVVNVSTAADGVLTRVSFQLPAPVPAPTAAGAASYSVDFQKQHITASGASGVGRARWMIRAGSFGRRFARPNHQAPAPPPAYRALGAGVEPAVTISADTLSITGVLPPEFHNGDRVTISARVQQGRTTLAHTTPQTITLSGLRDPQLHLASVQPSAGPFPVAYESFHYFDLSNSRDLACTVINALGDHYDFLAYYSDFRIDNAEAGTSSEGPRGAGPYAATGTGTQNDPGGTPSVASYCSPGRFQWGFIQPVSAGAIQMQQYPPPGTRSNSRDDIGHYIAQLKERTQNGKIPPYDYAMSQIGHEMDHRWNAFSHAKVNGTIIPLGDPYHWVRGLQAPAAFPYQRPTEASIMGGGVWQANGNGTYTQFDDNYYVPATGYSYLDLYNMGLIAASEVPNFFLLSHLVPDGHDAFGRPTFKADRTNITIQDVIAADGPREPDVQHSQKRFNTGMVVIVMHGHNPSPRLIQEANGIRLRWMDFFTTATGHRAVMRTNPH